MEDTPIYHNTANGGHIDNTNTEQGDNWIKSKSARRYLYAIAAAILVILSGYFGWDAIVSEQWLTLISAILNLGGAGAVALARVNVK